MIVRHKFFYFDSVLPHPVCLPSNLCDLKGVKHLILQNLQNNTTKFSIFKGLDEDIQRQHNIKYFPVQILEKTGIFQDFVGSLGYWNSDTAKKQHLQSSFRLVNTQTSQEGKDESC